MLLSLLLPAADVPNSLSFLASLRIVLVLRGLLFFVSQVTVSLRIHFAVAAHVCLLRLVRASRIEAPAP